MDDHGGIVLLGSAGIVLGLIVLTGLLSSPPVYYYEHSGTTWLFGSRSLLSFDNSYEGQYVITLSPILTYKDSSITLLMKNKDYVTVGKSTIPVTKLVQVVVETNGWIHKKISTLLVTRGYVFTINKTFPKSITVKGLVFTLTHTYT